MEKKKYDVAVFIGRFQPFHKGHMHVLKEAAKLANRVIVMIGSCNGERTLHNPLTGDERVNMIDLTINFSEDLKDVFECDVNIVKMKDCATDEQWKYNLTMEVERIIYAHGAFKPKKICLVGHNKDATSFYLKFFPEWDMHDTGGADVINATDIRRAFWLDKNDVVADAVDPVVRLMFPISENYRRLKRLYSKRDKE